MGLMVSAICLQGFSSFSECSNVGFFLFSPPLGNTRGKAWLQRNQRCKCECPDKPLFSCHCSCCVKLFLDAALLFLSDYEKHLTCSQRAHSWFPLNCTSTAKIQCCACACVNKSVWEKGDKSWNAYAPCVVHKIQDTSFVCYSSTLVPV